MSLTKVHHIMYKTKLVVIAIVALALVCPTIKGQSKKVKVSTKIAVVDTGYKKITTLTIKRDTANPANYFADNAGHFYLDAGFKSIIAKCSGKNDTGSVKLFALKHTTGEKQIKNDLLLQELTPDILVQRIVQLTKDQLKGDTGILPTTQKNPDNYFIPGSRIIVGYCNGLQVILYWSRESWAAGEPNRWSVYTTPGNCYLYKGEIVMK